MRFPNTPISIIEKLANPDQRDIWNGAWRNFFDIYHAPIKVMVVNSFAKSGWHNVPPQILEDVIVEVVVSLNKVFVKKAYELGKTKFRFFLKTICRNRAMDYMRKNFKDFNTDSIDIGANEDEKNGSGIEIQSDEQFVNTLENNEIAAFQSAVILDMYESIRKNLCPSNCLVFEMAKLEGKKVSDVAKELDMDPKQISSIIFKVSKKIRDELISKKIYEELK